MGFSINDILVQSVKDKIWVGNYVYFMDTLVYQSFFTQHHIMKNYHLMKEYRTN